MAVSASFLELAKETFGRFGDISIRRMFGGAGVYCDGAIFALLDDDAVFFKVDYETRPAFEKRKLKRWGYQAKEGYVESNGYFVAPEIIFDDPDELKEWTTLAIAAGRRAAKIKKPTKKKKKA
jgi:DNA transformation protein